MAAESDQLKRDIERTRRELSQDVDALTEKVTPARVVQRRVERTKNAVGNIRERVMGPATERFSSQGTTSYRSSGPGVGERASEALSSATSSVASTASDAGDAALGAVDTAKAKAEGNPLAAGVIAFGVGWLASSLLPASRREQQAAARVKDVATEHAAPVQEKLKEMTGQMQEALREPAQQAVESVKSTATDAVTSVKDEAASSATGVKDDAKTAGQTIRAQTKPS
jgi:gas vesicle protein